MIYKKARHFVVDNPSGHKINDAKVPVMATADKLSLVRVQRHGVHLIAQVKAYLMPL